MENNDNIVMSRIAFERMQSKMDKFQKYNLKCIFFNFRFRKGKDDKYIEFLKNCPNKMEFIRNAIDKEMA